MVLNLVARLKEVGAQLARKSVRSASQLSLFAELPQLASVWPPSQAREAALGPESALATSGGASKSRSLVARPAELAGPLALESGRAEAIAKQPTGGEQHVEPDGEAAESEGDAEEPEAEQAGAELNSDESEERAGAGSRAPENSADRADGAHSEPDADADADPDPDPDQDPNADTDADADADADSDEQVPKCKMADCIDLLIEAASTGSPPLDQHQEQQQHTGEPNQRPQTSGLDEQQASNRLEPDGLDSQAHNRLEIVAPKYQVPSVNVAQQNNNNNNDHFVASNEISTFEQQSNQLIQVPDGLAETPMQTNNFAGASSGLLLTLGHLTLLATLVLIFVLLYKFSLHNLKSRMAQI